MAYLKGITLSDGSDIQSIDGTVLVEDTGVAFSNGVTYRNAIINGDMAICQRFQNGKSYTNVYGDYTVDRWKLYNTISTIDLTHSYGISSAGIGQKNTLGFARSDRTRYGQHLILQKIESFNISDWGFGNPAPGHTARNDYISLQFWAYTQTNTGTFSVAILNEHPSVAAHYVTSFELPTLYEWKKIEKIIPIIHTGNQWQKGTVNAGMVLCFDLGSSSTFATTNENTWGTGNKTHISGSTEWDGAITGVQLEYGSNPTEFEHLPHDVNLRRCQRYYEWGAASGSGYAQITSVFDAGSTSNIDFKVSKRVVPTMTNMSLAGGQYPNNQSNSVPRYEGGYSRGFRYTTHHNTTFWNVTTGNGGSSGPCGHQIIWEADAEI